VVSVTSLRPYSRFSRQEPLLFCQVAPQLNSRGEIIIIIITDNIYKFMYNKFNQFVTRYSSVLDVQLFLAADCDSDHCLVVEKVRERLAVNKQILHRLHVERFNLKKLNEVDGQGQFRGCRVVSAADPARP
jgi:hypothetical protein